MRSLNILGKEIIRFQLPTSAGSNADLECEMNDFIFASILCVVRTPAVSLRWRSIRLPESCSKVCLILFFSLPLPPPAPSLADPVGKSIEYATKTQTEEKLGDTWLNNHRGTLIFEGEKASEQYQRASAGGSEAGRQNAITGQDATWGGAEEMKTAPKRGDKRQRYKTRGDKTALRRSSVAPNNAFSFSNASNFLIRL